jgi:hypothetical protein
LKGEHSTLDYIIVKLVDVGQCSDLGPRNVAERMEIEAIDGTNNVIDEYSANGEEKKRGGHQYHLCGLLGYQKRSVYYPRKIPGIWYSSSNEYYMIH